MAEIDELRRAAANYEILGRDDAARTAIQQSSVLEAVIADRPGERAPPKRLNRSR